MTATTITREQLVSFRPCDLEERLNRFGDVESMNVSQAFDAGFTVYDILWIAGKLGLADDCVEVADYAARYAVRYAVRYSTTADAAADAADAADAAACYAAAAACYAAAAARYADAAVRLAAVRLAAALHADAADAALHAAIREFMINLWSN